MGRRPFADQSVGRLRMLLAAFFLALAIPTGVLLKQSYSQLKWEAFHNQRLQAEELLVRIDARYGELVDRENARAFTDYTFLNVAGDGRVNVLQRSQLSAYPVQSAIPGTIGYFQIDHTGRFSTPLIPKNSNLAASHGVDDAELAQRRALHDDIYAVLSDNRLVAARPVAVSMSRDTAVESAADRTSLSDVKAEHAERANDGGSPESIELDYAASAPSAEQPSPAQAAFDELGARAPAESDADASERAQGLGRLSDLKLERQYEARIAEQEKRARAQVPLDLRARQAQKLKRAPRKEQNVLLEEAGLGQSTEPAQVSMFESEIDTLEFSLLDSGHFVFYRNVWRDEQRHIQGMLIDAPAFIDAVIRDAFYQSGVSRGSSVAIAYQGNVLRTLSSQGSRGALASTDDMQGTLLLQRTLSDPLSRMEMVFSVNRLPAGPGGAVLAWTALVLLLVFGGGFYLMYRLGLRQIGLARQQQDFVSAVSHELKTPLTSIRMYGEMLREGWAPEDKRKLYYDYIFDESERLSRLINNVLQLARMSRNDMQVELKPCSVAQLLDIIRSKASSQVERAGFTLTIDCDDGISQRAIEIDSDYFTQVIINLIDNALKFSATAEQKRIDIGCRLLRDDQLQLSVRDYGSGIPRDQLRKIFRLFYRMENELTRETVGTGIGLALVHGLIDAMHGEIDVVNQNPGAEFRLTFPLL